MNKPIETKEFPICPHCLEELLQLNAHKWSSSKFLSGKSVVVHGDRGARRSRIHTDCHCGLVEYSDRPDEPTS